MPKIKLRELVVDNDIYPRQHLNQKTIESYAESLGSGAKFPAIEVQRIKEKGEGKIIVIDGLHRVKAHEEARLKEIDAFHWKNEVLDKSENLKELRIEAINKNLMHGDRLLMEDKKTVCRKMAGDDKEIKITQKEFGKIFGVGQKTVSDWIKDIRAKQKGTRNNLIYKLYMLGFTQEEIAKKIGLARQTITDILAENGDFAKIGKEFDGGKAIEDIAEYRGLDLITTWAMVLRNKTDVEKLEILTKDVDGLNCKPRPYDVWNFAQSHDLMGSEYEGRIPGQLILQLLYFYTKPKSLVVDPMAGSGTVIDACLLMNRRCLAYDINPIEDRVDIQKSDSIEAIKNLKNKPNLIFFDPPYFKKKEREYGKKAVSSLSKDKYLNYFSNVAKACRGRLAPEGRVAFLMSDYTEDNPADSIFIHHYINRFEKEGFITERLILCPLSPEQMHADIYLKFVKTRRLGRLARYLVIFRASRPK